MWMVTVRDQNQNRTMARRSAAAYLILTLLYSYVSVTRQCIRRQTTTNEDSCLFMDASISQTGNDVLNTRFCDESRISHDESGIYSYSSTSFPRDARFRPSISNGHVATVVQTDTIHVNGLYNGRLINSHRAIIPSTVNSRITGINNKNLIKRWYTLNAKKGIYQETLIGDHVTVYYRLYAHRTVAPLVVLEIEAIRHIASLSTITIHLNTSQGQTSPDITFYENRWKTNCTRYMTGRINEPETDWSGRTEVHVIYDVIPERLIMASSETHATWTFLTSVHVIRTSATEAYENGRLQIKEGTLYCSHVTAWMKLWSLGTIELKGDRRLAKMVTGSLYYILSSLPIRQDPEWPFFGLSPNGLPWGKKDVPYYGGVFWDQDTWMYPAILALHQDLAKVILDTRKRTISAAIRNAKFWGYKGLKYAWESRFTGIETTRAELLAKNELHINNDVAFAILQYYWATDDVTIFQHDVFGDIIIGIADFWISKLRYNETLDKYVILDVCGPDEYHSSVNNSVYTNVGVKLILEAAANLTQPGIRNDFKQKQSKYQYYADNIYVPFDAKDNYHPEYDSYTIGTIIKQADVILLGYPLMYNMTREQRRSDLEVYERVTDVNGPAMTWCMHAIAWLELGEENKTFSNLKKAFDNVASVFQVWSEEAHKRGAPNFITGQGGFLQAILFGYCGFRIKPRRLDLNFVMPPSVTELRIIGLDFLGNTLNFAAFTDYVNITVTERAIKSSLLIVYQQQERHYLQANITLQIRRHRAYIVGQ